MRWTYKSGIARRCAAVSPTAIQAYLQSHGWVHEENWRERIAVWSLESDGQIHQILAPLLEVSERYHARISDALATLAELEMRSQLDVYYDLIGAGADVIRLRPLNGAGQFRLDPERKRGFSHPGP